MKVCVFGTRGFPDVQGGVEKHCENLYPRFPSDCQFTVFRRRSYIHSNTTYPCIHFIDLPSTRIKGLEAACHSFLAAVRCLFERPDLVHIHNIGPACFSPLIRLFGIPVVLTFHSPNYEHAKWGPLARLFLKGSERIALRCANAVIFVNRFQMQKYSPAIQRKSRYVPNGIDRSPQTDRTDILSTLGLEPGRYILAVGRITPEKGFGRLIDAFRQLPQAGYKLVIAGGVDNENEYAQTLKDKARDSSVLFAGYVSGEPLHQLFCHARLFVLPSLNEGFPLVLLEAMAAGCDVLASDIPATHLVDLQPEDYFNPGDTNELAAKLQQKLNQPKPSRSYDLAPYDWNQIAAQTWAVYQRWAK